MFTDRDNRSTNSNSVQGETELIESWIVYIINCVFYCSIATDMRFLVTYG